MIFEVQSYWLIFQDAVYSLGVGFATGVFYQLISVFLYKGKIAVFIRDVVAAVFFTVAVFSYSISFANYRILRWYNIFFALIGWIMFTPAFSNCMHRYTDIIILTAKDRLKRLAVSVSGKLSVKIEKIKGKNQKNTQKNSDEVLKEREVLLYN